VPTTALEAARSEAALGLLVEARNRVESVLAIVASPGEPRELGEAREAASQIGDDLDARIPSVRVVIEGDARDAAALAIDGEPIPSAARGVSHRLNPGAHVISARAPDGREGRALVTLREREARRLVIALPNVPSAAAEPPSRIASAPLLPSEPPSAPPARRGYTIAYVSFGVAGAGALTFAISGIVALVHRDAAAAHCTGGRCPPATFPDLDTASTASTIADVGLVIAGAGVAVGLADLLLDRGGAKATSRGVGPFVGVGTAGLRGAF
jgi:hypothetical protein